MILHQLAKFATSPVTLMTPQRHEPPRLSSTLAISELALIDGTT